MIDFIIQFFFYKIKIETQLEENNKNNSKKYEEDEANNASNVNCLEELRINLKKEKELNNNENDIKIRKGKESRNRIRTNNIGPHKRRKSNKFIVRESDVFMRGPWILDEEKEDNLDNENTYTDKIITSSPLMEEDEDYDKKKKLRDVKMNYLQNIEFEKVVGEFNDNNKEETSIDNNIIENKSEVHKTPEKKRSFFTKIFNILKIKINHNNNDDYNQSNDVDKNNGKSQEKVRSEKGVLSDSSASSVSDSTVSSREFIKEISKEKEKEIDENTKSSEITPTITIDNTDDNNIFNNKNELNLPLLDQVDNEDNNSSSSKENNIETGSINRLNLSRMNRSHSLYITEKEKEDYLSSVDLKRKRKRIDKFIQNDIQINQNSKLFKRSRTEIDNFDINADDLDKEIGTVIENENINLNKNINVEENNREDIATNIFVFNKPDIDYFLNKANNLNNNINNTNEKNNTCSSYNSSVSELKDSKFMKLIKDNNKNMKTESEDNNSSWSNSKIKRSHEKLSILPNDYDFSEIDENFDNIFGKPEEKHVSVNMIPFSSVLNESTIYPISNNLSTFHPMDTVLNSTMIKRDIDNGNRIKNMNKNNNLFNTNVDKPIIIHNETNIIERPSETNVYDNLATINDDFNTSDFLDEDSSILINKTKDEFKQYLLNIDENDFLSIFNEDPINRYNIFIFYNL